MRTFFVHILAFIVIAAALIFAYQPALFQDYVYHDDVTYFYMTPLMPEGIGFKRSFSEGRFLGSHIYVALGQLVNSVKDLRYVRWISALQLIISCFLLFWQLKKWLKNPIVGLLLAITIFTLPPFQIFVSHAGMAFQSSGILFALLSAAVLTYMPTSGVLWKRFLHPSALGGIVLMFAAVTSYPPTAMYFWVVAGIRILAYDHQKKLIEYLQDIINRFYVGFAAIGIFGIILKLVKNQLIENTQGIYNPYAISTNYFVKLKWFFSEPMNFALHLWDVFPQNNLVLKMVYVGMFILCACVLVAELGKYKDFNARRRYVINSIALASIFLVLIVLSFLPNIVATSKIPFYRCCVALTSLLFLMLFWGVLKIINFNQFDWKQLRGKIQISLFVLTLLVLCCYGALQAKQTLSHYRVEPSQKEYAYLENILLSVPINEYRHFHFIQPLEKDIYSRSDEYGMLTSVFTNDLIGLVTIVLTDRIKDYMELYHMEYDNNTRTANFIFSDKNDSSRKMHYAVIITGSHKKIAKEAVPKDVLAIDMTKLLEPDGDLSYLGRKNL